MGKRSVKKDKNIYQLSRENAGLSREAASEALEFVSPERLEKIESDKTVARPEEALAMERVYKNPLISNWYCKYECPIGAKYEPDAQLKDLAQVTVELLAALGKLDAEKPRLIEISVDGRVNDFEREDFDRITSKLASVDKAIRNMRLWLEYAAQSGKIDEAPGNGS